MGPCHSGKAVLNPACGPVFFLAAGGLMPALKKDPLRPLSSEERLHMERLSRALGLPAALVTRAKVVASAVRGSRRRSCGVPPADARTSPGRPPGDRAKCRRAAAAL